MWDFLTFNTFIAKYVLIFFYYLFAFLLPVMIYVFRNHFILYIEKYIDKKYIWIIMIFFLFCIEIFLRMFFEMLIGYFDMHDYLYKILQKG